MSNPYHKPAGTSEGGQFTTSGSALGTLYHGGKKKLSEIDPSQLQSRDSGFYGKGFYAATTPEATKGFGGRITKLELDKEAKVLQASLKSTDAPAGLVEAVKSSELHAGIAAATARGMAQAHKDYVDSIPLNPLEWKNAVDRFATRTGYDAVKYAGGEVVIKNLSKIKIKK